MKSIRRRRAVCYVTVLMFLVGVTAQPVAAGTEKSRSNRVSLQWVGPKTLDAAGRRTKGHWIPRASSTPGASADPGQQNDRDWLARRVAKLPKEFRHVGDRIERLIRLYDWASIESRDDRRLALLEMGIAIGRDSNLGTSYRVGGSLRAWGAPLKPPAALRHQSPSESAPDGAHTGALWMAGEEIDEQPILEAIAEYEDAIAYSIAVEESLEEEMVYVEGLDWGSELGCDPPAAGPSATTRADENCFVEGAAAVGQFLRGIADVRSAREAIIAAANTFVNTIDDIYTQFANGQISQGAANAAVTAASTALRSAVGWQALGIAGAVVLTAAVAYIAYECIFGLPI